MAPRGDRLVEICNYFRGAFYSSIYGRGEAFCLLVSGRDSGPARGFLGDCLVVTAAAYRDQFARLVASLGLVAVLNCFFSSP